MTNRSKGFSQRDDNPFKLVNADSATILNSIKAANYGDHNLVVYPCLGRFEEFYIECCKDSILQRNDVFILVTFYQQASAVRKKLYQAGIDTARYEIAWSLVIIDSEAAYQRALEEPEKYPINNLITIMTSQLGARGKKGITILADLGVFVLNNRITDLLSYELSIPLRFNSHVRFICFYHKEDFNAVQQEQRKRICSHHFNNLIVS